MSAYLVIREGSKWSDVFRLTPGRQVSIGRAATNAIVVRDSQCSRLHAEIFQSGGRWFVRDLQSRNGTFVGLKRLTEDYTLAPGEVIRVGTMHLEYAQDLSRIFLDPPRTSDDVSPDDEGSGASESERTVITIGPPIASIADRSDDALVVPTAGHRSVTSATNRSTQNPAAHEAARTARRSADRQPLAADDTSREETITDRRDRSRYTDEQAGWLGKIGGAGAIDNTHRQPGQADLIPKVGRAAQLLCRLAFALAKAPQDLAIGELAQQALFVGTCAEAGAVLLLREEMLTPIGTVSNAPLPPANPPIKKRPSDKTVSADPESSTTPRPETLAILCSHTSGKYSYRRISAFLGETVLRDGEAVLARNVSGDPLLGSADSQGTFSTTSVVGAPIRIDGRTVGLIHLYTRNPETILDGDDLEFALAVADSVAMALDILRRQRQLSDDLSKTKEEVVQLRERLGVESKIVGASNVVALIHEQIGRAAPTRATVLIRGESGVGKELVAQAIHATSDRRRNAFVCLNCAALSETLLESELFGHERGAFTGATDRKLGKFEAADKGTLLLDEVGEMSLAIQAKFLRVLEGHPFERVGGNRPITCDVRVIAATNRDLEQAVRENRFRSDLYFRLRVVEIKVAPLRSRRDDIIELSKFFLDRFNRETGRKIRGLTEAARRRLIEYEWPGNVRELKNVMERAVVLARGDVLDADDLSLADFAPPTPPPALPTEFAPFGSRETEHARRTAAPSVPAPPVYEPLPLADLERRHIYETLDETGGNKSRAAAILGIERSTLDRKLKKYEDASDEGG